MRLLLYWCRGALERLMCNEDKSKSFKIGKAGYIKASNNEIFHKSTFEIGKAGCFKTPYNKTFHK